MVEAAFLYRFKRRKERWQLYIVAESQEDAEEYMRIRFEDDDEGVKILDKKFKKISPFECGEAVYVGERRNTVKRWK